MPAACHIDHPGAPGQLGEQRRVQDTARPVRQRQHADAIIALGQKGAEFAVAGITSDSGDMLAALAPARQLKVEGQEALGNGRADIAQAQHADACVARGPGQHALPPLALPLRRTEEALTAMDDQDLHGHILRHLVDQGGIDETHQRHGVRIFGVTQKAVHARPQRNHRLQIGQRFEKSRLRPEAGEIGNLFRPICVTVGQHAFNAMSPKAVLADGVPARRQHALEQDFRLGQHHLLWFLPATAPGGPSRHGS